MGEAEQARRYEKRYPGATDDESQRAARQDRMDFKDRQGDGRRGSRFVSVPALPWHEERDSGDATRASGHQQQRSGSGR